MIFRTCSLLAASALGASAIAQLPLVDIALFDMGNGTLEVRFRPDLNFDGVVASSVFTIRWDAASGANLGPETQPVDVIPYHSVSKSGGEVDDGTFRYQPFAGFGFSSLQAEGTMWLANNEYVLCTIPVQNGTSLFQLVNDGWTTLNNGDYFVSLNGDNQTGIIYGNPSLTVEGVSLGAGVHLQPNPASTRTELTLSAESAHDVVVRLCDPAGREMWQKSYASLIGTRKETIDLTGFSAGTYLLRVRSAEGAQVQRLVIQ
ncbi:MAG: T9SS type A sorting domain-containing protein [Flavobacteriales bacterium]